MTDKIELAQGITMIAGDLVELNRFLASQDALLPGVAVLLMGELEPGSIDAAVVQGEPLGKVIHAHANGTLKRAAVVSMTIHYDSRHCLFLQRGIVRAVATARGMTAQDEEAAETLSGDTGVPAGDLPIVEEALATLVAKLDEMIGYPVIGNAKTAIN